MKYDFWLVNRVDGGTTSVSASTGDLGKARSERFGAGRRQPSASLAVVIFLAFVASDASATQAAEQVYRNACVVCHSTGTAGAPKTGDLSRWKRLAREGQARITAHGWLGEGAMPARGGQPNLSLEAFSAVVVYMANASGQSWREPDASMRQRIENEIAAEVARRALKVRTAAPTARPPGG
jgi:cytochrome c5